MLLVSAALACMAAMLVNMLLRLNTLEQLLASQHVNAACNGHSNLGVQRPESRNAHRAGYQGEGECIGRREEKANSSAGMLT